MPTQTFPFDTASNYTYDNTKVEITGGKAKLKLADYPGNDFEETFDSDTGFTYDPTKAEFAGGLVRQKDQRPVNASCGATYTTDINLNWGNGVLTGTAFGGATVVGGKLNLTGATKRVRYEGAGNADCTQTGCVRFKYTPNYTGAPVADRCLLSLLSALGSSNSLIQLTHVTSNSINIWITDTTGGNIVNSFSSTISLVSGTEYEFELDWNLTSGVINLFLNGIAIRSYSSSTGTRNSSAYIYIGATFSIGSLADGYFNDFEIFSSPQHTANYTPGYTVPETIYAINNVILPEMEYTGAGALIAVTAFTTVSVNSPRITLQIGRSGDWLYWDGSQWAVSNDTYAQANDPATFAAHATSLDVLGEIYGQFKIYFTGSNTISSFSDLLITLTAQIYPLDNPTVEINSRWYLDELESFTESSTKTGSDQIKYILKKDDTWYWFNAGVLSTSNGTYTQANTAAEIQTYKALFTVIRIYFAVKLFLHSADGTTSPEIDTLTIQYSYAGETPDTINKCLVYNDLKGFTGTAKTTPFYVYPINRVVTYKGATLLEDFPDVIKVTPDSTGYWEVELVENENMDGNQGYVFQWNKYDKTYKLVPNEVTAAYNTLEDWDEEA